MATGDSNDFLSRLKALLPYRWFSAYAAPNRDAVLGGISDALAWTYSLVQYAKAQIRIATATGPWLDVLGLDYLGLRVTRKAGQPDSSWRVTLAKEIIRTRVTRAGIVQAVEDITSQPATIFEPFNAADTGGLGYFGLNEPTCLIGSLAFPHTVLVNAVEPGGGAVPSLSGLNDTWGGLGAGAFALADLSTVTGVVTNQNVYDMINAVRAAGITAWVYLGPPPVTGGRLDESFYLDTTPLL